MAAFQGGAAANNICHRAESWRYLGTATFMFKELHLEKLRREKLPKCPPPHPKKKKVLRENTVGEKAKKENKGTVLSQLSAHYPLLKMVATFKSY